MTPGLVKKLRESMFEIFSNAVIHSRTKYGIFSCGQYYPQSGRLVLCISDLGVGIKTNVNETLGLKMVDEQAIQWATQDRNTTKRGPIPGGLGLKILKEFICMNGGSLQIASECGYWSLCKGHTSLARFPDRFPGTVVAVEINTKDGKSYALASEVQDFEIF
jgi:hypothetical protein